MTNTSRDTLEHKVFLDILIYWVLASLVFALDYLQAHDFKKLVKKNKLLSEKLRSELIKIGRIPEFHLRKDQSTIVSIHGEEAILKQLEKRGVRASYRGKYLRFSIHFYNSTNEIENLIGLIK